MPLFYNSDSQSRVWPGLSVAGRTLELESGASADLDLSDDFVDAWLKPVPSEPAGPRRTARKAEIPVSDATDVAEPKE